MKKLSLFFLLIISSLALSSLFIFNVNAQTSYNWIQNSGFDDGGNQQIIINEGFELGLDVPPTTAENPWTEVVSNVILNQTTTKHSGTYGARVVSTTGRLGLFLDELPLGRNLTSSEVISFTFWHYGASGNSLRYQINYTDGTNEQISPTHSGGSWLQVDATSELDVGKTIYFLQFWFATGDHYYDDFSLIILGSGQTEITPITQPWFNLDILSLDSVTEIINSISQTPSNSLLTWNTPSPIMQVINYLDSNTVTEVSLYAYCPDSLNGVRFSISYADTVTVSQIKNITSTDTWQKLTFDTVILSNRVITGIIIDVVYGTESNIVYIDTISMLSTIPLNQASFSFNLTPEPIYLYNTSFTAYQRTTYTLICYVYDNNGVINATGTFIITTTKGIVSGDIENGIFMVSLVQRVNSVADDITEDIIINIVSDTKNMTVSIRATWVYVSVSGTIPDTPTATTMQTQFLTYFPVLLVFALFTIPATYWLGIAGFLGGIDLSFLFCTWFGLLPSWGIAILVLINVVLIFFKVNSSGKPKDSEEP